MPHLPISTATAPAAIGAYSQAYASNGFIFTSGQIPVDPETGEVVGTDSATQAPQAIKNAIAILQAAGLGVTDIVKATIFITDMSQFTQVNEAYAAALGAHRPARSVVEVSALPKGVHIEIELIARAPAPTN